MKSRLRILLDIQSMKSEASKRLLSYSDNNLFEFIAIGESKNHISLTLRFTEDPYQSSISVDKTQNRLNEYEEVLRFGYNIEDIKAIAKDLSIKYDDLLLVFILQSFHELSENIILITERKKTLSIREKSSGLLSNLLPFSIFSPQEASIYIDLYCKKHQEYFLAPHHVSDKGLWYLYSMKSKIPEYQMPWSVIVGLRSLSKDPSVENFFNSFASFGDRLIEMLIAVDEIGKAFYEGPDNNTLDTIIYHFNYWVCLYSGIIDSLAWISKYRYEIPIANEIDVRFFTSKKDNNFVAELDKNSPELGSFIRANLNVIKMISGARDTILHRERLRGVRYINPKLRIKLNTINVPEEIYANLKQVLKLYGSESSDRFKLVDSHLIEPYSFVKGATIILFKFVNEYLKLLKFESYIQANEKLKELVHEGIYQEDFLKTMKIFKKLNLGY